MKWQPRVPRILLDEEEPKERKKKGGYRKGRGLKRKPIPEKKQE
jgi:hypothetical protein